MTRILITGSRDWINVNAVKGALCMAQQLAEGPSEAYPRPSGQALPPW